MSLRLEIASWTSFLITSSIDVTADTAHMIFTKYTKYSPLSWPNSEAKCFTIDNKKQMKENKGQQNKMGIK